jgi:hypothetical protein
MTVKSPQNHLPVIILVGFISLLASVIAGLPVLILDWSLTMAIFAFVLLTIGLVFLIAAWQIRQGLVNGLLVRNIIHLINLAETMKKIKQ